MVNPRGSGSNPVPPFYFLHNMVLTEDNIVQVACEKAFEAYQVFKDCFGEDHVDFQMDATNLKSYAKSHDLIGLEVEDARKKYAWSTIKDSKIDILVWWPKVTVSNEQGQSIEITDLYARVPITSDGYMPYDSWGFYLARASYTRSQFRASYLHSHIIGIPFGEYHKFQEPCLGQASIKQTISTLKQRNDIVNWMLFCRELAVAVTVESLEGHPYKSLESVTTNSWSKESDNWDENENHNLASYDYDSNLGYAGAAKDFFKYYLENGHFKVNFINNRYVLGMPYVEYVIDVSNAFVDFYNKHVKDGKLKSRIFLFDKNLIYEAKILNGAIHKRADYSRTIRSIREAIGTYLFPFKGKRIGLEEIPENITPSEYTVTLLCVAWRNLIAGQILRIINFKYEGKRTKSSEGGEETPSQNDKKTILI